ncbi:hypothetical protein G7Y89_g4827 [Cudoniella acicularis]|uniref:NADPH-dependent FMN reductase-like domain-containing protein n=1 Tax=Cudoniella acicularis TaxID=354080 RepID=A0A8H4W4K2_9HELO|nr:hypothetical protein G7Y89_g4827 [Cudoniella acicularis]
MATTTSPKPHSIGVVICSSRQPRVCPQIASFVSSTITSLPSYTSNLTPPTLTTIDLLEWNLPMFNEPLVPAQIHTAADYVQPHTQAWSLEIQKYNAFIFVLPQYNWGYPAVLKNAIDYLFNEWKGKPAMIVSYGGHGGGKAAAQLRQVLDGVGMKNLETMVALSFPSRDVTRMAATGKDIGLEGETTMWDGEKGNVEKAWRELEGALVPPVVEG